VRGGEVVFFIQNQSNDAFIDDVLEFMNKNITTESVDVRHTNLKVLTVMMGEKDSLLIEQQEELLKIYDQELILISDLLDKNDEGLELYGLIEGFVSFSESLLVEVGQEPIKIGESHLKLFQKAIAYFEEAGVNVDIIDWQKTLYDKLLDQHMEAGGKMPQEDHDPDLHPPKVISLSDWTEEFLGKHGEYIDEFGKKHVSKEYHDADPKTLDYDVDLSESGELTVHLEGHPNDENLTAQVVHDETGEDYHLENIVIHHVDGSADTKVVTSIKGHTLDEIAGGAEEVLLAGVSPPLPEDDIF